jgi:hypothetical protein
LAIGRNSGIVAGEMADFSGHGKSEALEPSPAIVPGFVVRWM